jgi:hypothetical protein
VPSVVWSVPAPFIPPLGDDMDTRHFDEEFTKMDLSTSLVEMKDREATHSDTFMGFSFIESHVELPADEPSYRRTCPRTRAASPYA